MDHPKDIESTLNALLLNAKELQETADDSYTDIDLGNTQKRLLDALFEQWNSLSEEEKQELLSKDVEGKVLELSRTNQTCLRKVRSKNPSKKQSYKPEQLSFLSSHTQ